jgi:chromosomal replication initiation ATPase DnaA
MITIEKLKEAINAIFAERPPNKELSSCKVREFVADYLNAQEADILMEDLKAALRDTPFARPRAMLRGSSRLSWYFVGQQTTTPAQPSSVPPKVARSKQPPRSKEKPLSESQRLKR